MIYSRFFFGLALGLATFGFHPSAMAAAPRPNVIFILCDDLGYGDVGVFYQNKRAAMKDRSVPFFTTPHIDTMARDGAKLMQHYSGAPVCAPSRGSLLTGLTQGHCNVRDNQFDKALADTHTLGTVMRQAGYSTAAFGKWGLQGGGEKAKKGKKGVKEEEPKSNGVLPESWVAYPTKRGFDDYFGYVRHVDGHFHYPKEDGREVWSNDAEVSADLDKCYTADLFTARAKKWITDQTTAHPEKPFFIYLAYDTPHAKLQNPPCAYPDGGGLKGGVQWTGKAHAMLNTAIGEVDGYMHPDYATATWDDDHDPSTPEVAWPEAQKRYANDVRRIDFCVGDVLQLLTDLKIADNTLVVFTSDNGPSQESYLPNDPYEPTFFRGFGPFDGIKRDTWEGGMREPTLVRWPAGIAAGSVHSQLCGHWDWLSTFADAAGLPAPAASDGVSLLPSLTGKGTQREGIVYIEYFQNGRTPKYAAFDDSHQNRQRGQMQNIYLNGYKGVRYNVQSADDDFEIYDLAKDERELTNLATRSGMAELQAAMKARVLQVRIPNDSAPRPYDKAAVPAVLDAPSGASGLAWSLFAGEWPWIPDFRTLEATKGGESNKVELTMAPSSGAFGASFMGYFHAKQDGEYAFTLDSDTGAMLFLHDIRLIDEPLKSPAGSHSGSVNLKAGWHPMRVLYRHAGAQAARLKLTVQLAGQGDYELSEEVFRSGKIE
ncbi:MAG: sulfatase-like hydrolase/transferase [Verrucomicrobiales bacterium]|nr:sulfatase-like hydrolase/transferase [Verrucomicrobiales bacterium]MCP5559217.1 sulfatase-like hydrolase/transferase [Verrucomicrobiaceae bacterium]